MRHVNDAYVSENPAFEIVRTRARRALRWRDFARDWGVNFAKTRTGEEFAIPAGFHEGATACLWLPDGRYTGSFHVSWASARAATGARRDVIERFRPILADICDMLRDARTLADALAPGAHALLITVGGTTAEVPGRPTGPVLGERGGLRRLLLGRSGRRRRRFLWPDDEGACHKVELFPCRAGTVVVAERLVPWPYGLTLRELEVLCLVADGLSNAQIGEDLVVSPRTVSTHVEHILSKLSCSSRAQLAAKAVREGLLLADNPGRISAGAAR